MLVKNAVLLNNQVSICKECCPITQSSVYLLFAYIKTVITDGNFG